MRKLLLAAVMCTTAVPMGSALAAGCTVTPLAPNCTYVAAGGEIARGGASSTLTTCWEASVVRPVNGVPTKVRLAGECSLLDADPEGHPIAATAGETVTLELTGGDQGYLWGVVTVS
jgi:hypothetical protein